MPIDRIIQNAPTRREIEVPQPLIESLSLRSGSSGSGAPLTFSPATVNVFVGPNHSGKSLLLREIATAIQDPQQARNRKVLSDIVFTEFEEHRRGNLVDELRAAAQPSTGAPESNVVLSKAHWREEFSRPHFEQLLTQVPVLRDPGQHQYFRRFFLAGTWLSLGGAERLNMLQATKREPPNRAHYYVHVLSRLFYSDEKRKALQQIVKEAFQTHFVIDPLGENFEAKLSAVEPALNVERSLGSEAVEFFAKALSMNEMSDGVRAFCGSIAAVVASDANVILIDEPEAFLHPALVVKLAKELCKRAQQNRQQVFVATHSAPFLLGCIQAGIDINIIRLTYSEGSATSRILSQSDVVPLMRQPLPRSIGALTGIFYQAVIVTEADADRAFYDEINHRCLSAGDRRGIPDGLFLNAQNWQTTARIIGPLRALGVAAAAIVDADLLLETKSDAFQKLMESAGMPPSSRQALGQLRGQLHALLKPRASDLKRQGLACVSGSEKQDLQNFIDQLGSVGVFIVSVGELEGWLPGLKRESWNGKNEWLLRTFEAMGESTNDASYLKPADDDVWDFVGRIRKWLSDPSRLGMPN